MELRWVKEEFTEGRVDYDLLNRLGILIGYFRDYKPGYFHWVSDCNLWAGGTLEVSNLKEAKLVAEAMIRLEG
jgi:hypothetical protein